MSLNDMALNFLGGRRYYTTVEEPPASPSANTSGGGERQPRRLTAGLSRRRPAFTSRIWSRFQVGELSRPAVKVMGRLLYLGRKKPHNCINISKRICVLYTIIFSIF